MIKTLSITQYDWPMAKEIIEADLSVGLNYFRNIKAADLWLPQLNSGAPPTIIRSSAADHQNVSAARVAIAIASGGSARRPVFLPGVWQDIRPPA
jgi:hypothetical protein